MYALVSDLISESQNIQGFEPSNQLRNISGEFITQATQNNSYLEQAVAQFEPLPYEAKSWLSVIFGAVVENTQNATISAPILFKTLKAWLAKFPTIAIPDDDEDWEYPALDKEQQRIADALPPLCQGLVAHLARHESLRQQLASDTDFIERLEILEEYSYGLNWVKELLTRESGELILLEPTTQSAFKIAYHNVGNCFHLFSLIQHLLGKQIPTGKKPKLKIAKAAQGLTATRCSDEAWWHYGDCLSPTPDILGSIWGEAYVSAIPQHNEQKIIILWQPILQSRSWDSSFFGTQIEAIPASVRILQPLSANETQQLITELKLEV